MTAKDLAALSNRAGQIATEVKPLDSDPCASTLNLAVYHLRAAAVELQRVAEFNAERERR